MKYDVCVVGGGLVGLATARALLEAFPGLALTVVDKEPAVAAHQSSHNSGVVHSGLYYKPGSLKARLCVEGRDAVYELSERVGIAAARSGKLVIASHESEIPALDELERRGRENGLVGLRRLGPAAIREFEPEAVGVAALHVPEAGIADYPAVAGHLAREIEVAGSVIRTGAEVHRIGHTADGVMVGAGDEEFRARALINCAGLHSDRVAALAGVAAKVRIIPFRGEYYRLSDEAATLVRALIYPVPDPRFPFLGVHFTRKIDGSVEVGPNAVLALGREHYRGTKPDWREVRRIVAHPGFRRLARRHWLSGTSEMMNSRSRRLYARLARRLVPAVRMGDLHAGGSGVRAQAVASDGSLVDDFVFEEAGATIHVLNAPSPGATASLAIGRYIAERARPLVIGKPPNPRWTAGGGV
jgi:(S)-2-hydroxyglutarate dehydrogenase